MIDVCSTDHKPQSKAEMERIFQVGASLYRVSTNRLLNKNELFCAINEKEFNKFQKLEKSEGYFRNFGPWRVKPGGLSVSFFSQN